MIRVVVYLVLLAVIAAGAAWLADQPGTVAITWHGLQLESSLVVAGAALIVFALLAIALWSILRFVLRAPDLISMLLRDRRGLRGYQAISRGLVAIGAGDVEAARRYAHQANRIAPGDSLVLLLSAQAAQLSGNRDGAERAFRAMTARDDTKVLGLHGLFIEARRRGDAAAARAYAEEAAKAAPGVGWAGQAALEIRCAEGDWTGALAALESNVRGGLVDQAGYRRQRAVLLTARALALGDDSRDEARQLALEAVKLAPSLVPAAVLAGRRLAEGSELRKASRIIERAWRAHPHPELAETYANLRFGDSARDRLARVETLAQKTPGNPEGAIAVAQAAIDAAEFARARAVLRPLLAEPSRRVALLMARIEQREHGDEGRAREWIARAVHAARDPVWTADGVVSDHWLPVSPVTGRLDAFEWKVPFAELPHAGPVLDGPTLAPDAPAVEAEPGPPPPAPEASAVPAAAAVPVEPAAPEAAPANGGEPRAKFSPVRPPEPVIPLVHAPDDPGPDADGEPETEAETPPPATWTARQASRPS